MLHKLHFVIVLALLSLVTVLQAETSSVSGKAFYNDENTLPKNARFEVTLEDVSLADAPSVMIGKQVIDPAGQIPIYFKIDFDDAKIKLGQRYAVRAEITQGKRLLYVTDSFNPVFVGNDNHQLNLVLKRVAKVPESRIMEGMYKYMADAALFKDCVTGKYYPVAFEADNKALEEAYLKEVNGSNFFVKVELEGKIVSRSKMDGEGDENTLLVERFIRIMGLKDCTEHIANVPITNNYWKVMKLYGKEVKSDVDTGEAHILLREGLNGTGELKIVTGCQTIIGTYRIDENTIKLTRDKTGEKSENCPQLKLEEDFLLALDNTVYWRIEGEYLKLFDALDTPLAIFEAVYF